MSVQGRQLLKLDMAVHYPYPRKALIADIKDVTPDEFLLAQRAEIFFGLPNRQQIILLNLFRGVSQKTTASIRKITQVSVSTGKYRAYKKLGITHDIELFEIMNYIRNRP